MGDPDKAVFISYRRKLSPFVARSIFESLTSHGYDVFMDVESIDSGSFGTIIFHQIAARAHFLAILTPGALEPTSSSADWLRREVEHAIELRRNVVPVMAQGFDFNKEAEKLPGKRFSGGIEQLRSFNGIEVPHDYFNEAMLKLRERFLKKPKTVAITPAPPTELADVQRKIGQTINFGSSQSILNMFGLKASSFSKIPWFTLDAPTLSEQPNTSLVGFNLLKLKWTPVPRATKYVLEGGEHLPLSSSIELYKGDKTEFTVFRPPGLQYFRVKAENDVLNVESPWSNAVTSFGTGLAVNRSLGLLFLQPPKLEVKPDDFTLKLLASFKSVVATFEWTSVSGATGYVLEKSSTQTFSKSQQVYKGPNTAYNVCLQRSLLDLYVYFRVKAVGSSRYDVSLWSNVVKVNCGPLQP
jgi:hypothetical protein